MAHLQKGRRHIHGAKSRRAGTDTPFDVLIQLLHGGLRPVLRNDTQSAHNSSRFQQLKIFLKIVFSKCYNFNETINNFIMNI